MQILRFLCTVVMLGVLGLVNAPADEVEEGDTRDAVIEALGDPDGTVTLGDTEILYYKRGQVEIQGDKVTSQNIVSEAEAEARAKKRREEEAAYFGAIEKQKAAAKEARAAAAAERAKAVKKPTAEDLRRKAEIEAKVQAGLKDPPVRTSARKLRKYRRGRSASAVAAREEQLRKEYETD